MKACTDYGCTQLTLTILQAAASRSVLLVTDSRYVYVYDTSKPLAVTSMLIVKSHTPGIVYTADY